MTIENLLHDNEISVRTYNFCKSQDIHHLNDLLFFYEATGTFIKFKNCGQKSNKELTEICKKYSGEYLENKENKLKLENPFHIALRSLTTIQRENINSFIFSKINNFSVRSENALLRYMNGNITLDNFEKKILLSEIFKVNKLKNVGARSLPEIENFITNLKFYIFSIANNSNSFEVETPNQMLSKLLKSLNKTKRDIVNGFIYLNTNSLSVRSRNAISNHLNGNFKIKNFAEKILFSEKFNIANLNNVGNKCVPELEVYISIIKDFIYEVNQTKDEKYLIALKNKFLLQKALNINQIPDEILETESIFSFTNYLLDQNAFFDETQTFIVKKAFKLYHNQDEITLDDISNIVDLSRERVRQIRKICLDELFDKLGFIQNFNDDLFQKYGLDIASNYLEINKDVIEKINTSNNTHLSREFITYILSAYLDNQFSLIGNYEDVLQPSYFNSRNRHNWNNFYLIKKGIALEIDFNALANDIDNRINDRIVESYSFNFKSYLSKFLTNNNIGVLDLLFPICEKIINDEFQLYLDLDENLNFKRNTSRQAHEYAYEALEQLGKPSKVKEIFEKVLELHPNYETEEAKIRVAMKRKNGFVPIGRKSVFGLKKWENELENFKGGTIRTICEEFLLNFNEPQHKKEIENYVKQFRPKTNANSIYNNLYIDESNTFVFYENYYIGLSSKTYPDDFKILSKTTSSSKHTWDESLEILKEFIDKEKRLPYSSGCPKSEEKLYRWLNNQKVKQDQGELDKNKEDKLNSLLERYPNVNGRRRLNSNEKYGELISFVLINHRLPLANKSSEKNLYNFFYKQRKLFDKNQLDSKEEVEFIKVAKLFQNYKI